MIGVLTSSILFASSLSDDAKNASLKPIPNSALLIDNPKKPITKAKVELGKKTLQKSDQFYRDIFKIFGWQKTIY